jgi:hypothetical protein
MPGSARPRDPTLAAGRPRDWSRSRARASYAQAPFIDRPLGWARLACVGEFGLRSDAFAHGDEIPRRHTCVGDDVSPALSWSDPPAGTRALALIVDDPDAPVGTSRTGWPGTSTRWPAGWRRAVGPGRRAQRLWDGRLEWSVPAARARRTPLLLPAARPRRRARGRLPRRAARARAGSRRPRARDRRTHGHLRALSLPVPAEPPRLLLERWPGSGKTAANGSRCASAESHSRLCRSR